MENTALYESARTGNFSVADCCGLTHSRGNRNVADKDSTHMFQSVRAHWQLKKLLASCSKVHKPCILRHTAMSIVEDVEKLIWEVERRPPLCERN
jgi:hypothetical protein